MNKPRIKQIVIIGGVAAGASFAARARRLDENAQIIVVEKGPFVSFANCGLPYHLSGAIKRRSSLLLHTPQSLRRRYNLDVRTGHEALSIDRKNKTVTVNDVKTAQTYHLKYDQLMLATGASAVIPPVFEPSTPGVFTLQTIPQMDSVLAHIKENNIKSATVVGGGFIGIEVAENLAMRGIAVSIVEMSNQVLPPLDYDMAIPLHAHLQKNGVVLNLNTKLENITKSSNGLTLLCNGKSVQTEMVIMAVGVKPSTGLAVDAGLAIGSTGGVKVNGVMQTSDPDIYCAGDAAEVTQRVTQKAAYIPLAGPANRQARIAADAVYNIQSEYKGTLGTSICKVFELTAAATGPSEKQLKNDGVAYEKVVVHPASNAGYYPGSVQLTLKLLFSPDDGTVLGAQAIGEKGVDKRIDIIATAIAGKLTVFDLEHLELCYAPPFGSAKDPVNYAGYVASNLLKGLATAYHVEQYATANLRKQLFLDVRTHLEYKSGHIPNASHIPVDELRDRYRELPLDKEIVVYCQVGLRGHVACRILKQKGIDCSNMLGGYKSWSDRF